MAANPPHLMRSEDDIVTPLFDAVPCTKYWQNQNPLPGCAA
jgi:hypothetical protein